MTNSVSWISTKKAAELLGVCQRTIQNWVDEGKLKSTRTAGGHRRLNPEDIRKLLQERRIMDIFSDKSEQHFLDESNNGLLRVLIVEDDINLLRLCELRFSQFTVPHKFFTANDGYQGLLLSGLIRPHLIFTDLKMPQMNGLKMIEEILKTPEMINTKIVVVTGLETREIIKMGKLPEGITVLPKPIPFVTVETILYQHAEILNLELDNIAA